MTVLDAFHLPGLTDDDIVDWRTCHYDDHVVRTPVVAPATLRRIAENLKAERARVLDVRSARDIAGLIERATNAMLAGDRHRRTEHALVAITGYSLDMVRLVLERMSGDWRRPSLEQLLDAELGGGRVLDEFVRQPGRSVNTRAFGPELTTHIFAGNVPGVAVTALVRSLLVRSAVLGKTASGEPWLAASFARSLAEIDPDAGRTIAITYWEGSDQALGHAAMEVADAVVVYGGETAAAAVRAAAPASARVIEHGPRFSVGLVAREALADRVAAERTAADVALAVATFDQQGCVSPHFVWAEAGGGIAPRAFAALVAHELEALSAKLERGRSSAAEAAAIHDARTMAEFRSIEGRDIEVWTGKGTDWTVIWDGDGDFAPSPLGRTIRIGKARTLEDAIVRIAPFRAFLQTVGMAASPNRIAALAPRLAHAGASRITTFARMPWPPVDGHHDGRGPLRELCRWVDLEDGDQRNIG